MKMFDWTNIQNIDEKQNTGMKQLNNIKTWIWNLNIKTWIWKIKQYKKWNNIKTYNEKQNTQMKILVWESVNIKSLQLKIRKDETLRLSQAHSSLEEVFVE